MIFNSGCGRSHDVPEEHLGPVAGPGIMGDRYKVYQAVDKVKSGLIVLGRFCWVHVRRDFLVTGRSWPDQEAWAMGWVERIGELYRLNDQRLEVRDYAAAFAMATASCGCDGLRGTRRAELACAGPAPGAAEGPGEPGQPLDRDGFVEHPEVPMDNNTAERSGMRAGGRSERRRR